MVAASQYGSNLVTLYRFDASTGQLEQVGTQQMNLTPRSMVFTADGNFLVACANTATAFPPHYVLEVYSIATGSLSPVAGSPVSVPACDYIAPGLLTQGP
jgi:6-phosphogluconolactonase (cycloisomerase 2 family)